jgi:hypothetical protein
MYKKMENVVVFVHGIGKKNQSLRKIKMIYLVVVLVVHLNRMRMNFYILEEILLLNGNHQHIICDIYPVENK